MNLTWTRASGLVAAALLISAAAPGCRRRATNDAPSSASSAPATAPAPKPVDAVLPGELAEGAEKAFGLPIPRRMQVRGTYKDEVIAAGQVPAEQLANYVRQRVLAESVETGPAKTVFTRATVKSAPQRMLRIEVVSRRAGGTELIVRDQTRPPPEPGLTDAERWREKGLNPDGSPIDPTRLE